MCGLRQLAGAGTNWKFLLSPRPIKLRVNLALLIIAAGASPLKRITPASYLPNSEDGVLLHQADYYFSHLRKRRARKSCQGHRGKTEISWRESLRLMQTLSTRCIFSYSDYNKNTRATIFSPTLFCPVLKWTLVHKKFAPASASGRSFLFLRCRQQ